MSIILSYGYFSNKHFAFAFLRFKNRKARQKLKAPKNRQIENLVPKLKPADTVADCGLHGLLIIGELKSIKCPGPAVFEHLVRFKISLSCNGEIVDKGLGSNAMGNPIKAVQHLIEVLSKQSAASAIQANELITTGTLTAALPIKSGHIWSTELKGIGLKGISVTFEG